MPHTKLYDNDDDDDFDVTTTTTTLNGKGGIIYYRCAAISICCFDYIFISILQCIEQYRVHTTESLGSIRFYFCVFYINLCVHQAEKSNWVDIHTECSFYFQHLLFKAIFCFVHGS